MKISTTGATGFLGRKVIDRLVPEHDVVAWVRDPSKLPSFDARHFDLSQPNEIDLTGTDVFVHCAAYLPKSYEDPTEAAKCLMDNGVATLQLLQAAEKAGVKKFVYVSSGTIYDPSLWVAREHDRIYPSMRATYYLTSKVVGDIFVAHSKMDTVILRPSSIYGPGMVPRGFLPRLVEKLKDGSLKKEDIGNYEIDLVHVNDVAWMTAKSAITESIKGTFNVGGGAEITTFQVAYVLSTILNKPFHLAPMPEANGHAILDISFARAVGYNPISLENGLRSYIESL